MTRQQFEANMIGKHYDQLFKSVEHYLTRGNRKKLQALYKMIGQSGKNRSKTVSSFSLEEPFFKGLRNVSDPRSIFLDYINRKRTLRANARGNPVESKFKAALRGSVVSLNGRHFHPMGDVRWMVNRISQWRPNLIGHLAPVMSLHSLTKELSLDQGRLTINPTEAAKRRVAANLPADDDRHIPLVATDRFIMWFPDGVPDRICDGEDVQVAFITDCSKPRCTWGWLSKHGDEFGCSTTQSDARKAAKMRAVRKAKKALGLL